MTRTNPKGRRNRLILAALVSCCVVALALLLTTIIGTTPTAVVEPQPAATPTEPLRDKDAEPEAESEAMPDDSQAPSDDAGNAAMPTDGTQGDSEDEPIVDEKIANELIVSVEGSPEAEGLVVGKSLAGATITAVEALDGDTVCVTIDDQSKISAAIEELSARDGVTAQPNFVYRLMDVDEETLVGDEQEADATGQGQAAANQAQLAADSQTEPDDQALAPSDQAQAGEDEATVPTDEVGIAGSEDPESSVQPQETTDPNEAYEPNDAGLANQYYLLPQDPFKTSGANILNAWNLMRTEQTVTVATIDTGCEITHPDLSDNIDKKHAIDMYMEHPQKGVCYDLHGHGTHVAGIIAAMVDNKIGSAGVSYNAKVLPIKVFNNESGASASASTSTITKAYTYLEGLMKSGELTDLKVINMSLGGYGKSAQDLELEEQINNLADHYHVLTVCAGGNGNSTLNEPYTAESYPSDFDACLSVTALDKNGCDLPWSDYNEHKDISAPGDRIYSTYKNADYDTLSGTSMASPLVAGIAAMMYAADPTLTPPKVIEIMQETALPVPMTNAHGERVFGTRDGTKTGSAGAVDAAAAVKQVLINKGITKFIEPKDVTVSSEGTEYTKYPLTPEVTVDHEGTKLEENVNYTKTYKRNVKPGTATASVRGQGEWGGWITKPFTITIEESARPEIATVNLTPIPAKTYNYGEPIMPELKMECEGEPLIADEDYTVKYSNNVNAGTATVDIEGVGIYKGTRSETFTINPADGYLEMDEENTTITMSPKTPTLEYTIRCPQEMSFNATCTKPGVVDVKAEETYGNVSKRTYHYLTITPVGAGDTTITVSEKSDSEHPGNKNYTDVTSININVKVLESNMDVASADVEVAGGSVYTGNMVKPAVTVRMGGRQLEFGKDYGLGYYNNVYAGEGMVSIRGMGSYIGITSKKFEIKKAETPLALSTSSLNFTEGDGRVETVRVSNAIGDITATSKAPTVASAQVVNGSVQIKPLAVGEATVEVTCAGDLNHNPATKSITVRVDKKNTPSTTPDPQKPTNPDPQKPTKTKLGLTARAHVQNKGWLGAVGARQVVGTTGRALRVEAVQIGLTGNEYTGSVQVSAHVQNVGWQNWVTPTVKSSAIAGTSGRGLRVEAVRVRLTGEAAQHYDLWTRAHVQNIGWTGWVREGEVAGTSGCGYRVEAFEFALQPEGKGAPGGTAPLAQYRTHVQNVGWQPYVFNGSTAGTSGRALRLEGINLALTNLPYSGGIEYRTHVQNIGWQGWKSDGAMAGTSGRGLRLEAIEIKLTGELKDHYDVWYRVHCQNLGWMGWAKDGASSGSAGYGYRLEAIQIKLLPKGAKAPGSTARPFAQR